MEIHLLSVVVPVYKQEKTIKNDLENLYIVLSKTPYNFEIIPVIDGTNIDKSFTEAKKIKKTNIHVLGYTTNKGKGQAVRFGMKHAKGDVITFIDAGMDINPSSIVMLLEHMKWYDADIIVASKLHAASKVRNYPLWRTRGYYLLTKLLFHLKIRDTQTGLKAYKRDVIESIIDKMVIKTFAFDIELLAVASSLGYTKIYDCPVEINFDKKNTNFNGVNVIKSILQMSVDTFGIWYRLNILHYYSDDKNRIKKFDPELNLFVNTGDMKGSKQRIIIFVNNFMNKFIVIGSKLVHINRRRNT